MKTDRKRRKKHRPGLKSTFLTFMTDIGDEFRFGRLKKLRLIYEKHREKKAEYEKNEESRTREKPLLLRFAALLTVFAFAGMFIPRFSDAFTITVSASETEIVSREIIWDKSNNDTGLRYSIFRDDSDPTYETLVIYGKGRMPDYDYSITEDYVNTPWTDHTGRIKNVRFELDGAAYIGNNAFRNMSLRYTHIPYNIRRLGDYCFYNIGNSAFLFDGDYHSENYLEMGRECIGVAAQSPRSDHVAGLTMVYGLRSYWEEPVIPIEPEDPSPVTPINYATYYSDIYKYVSENSRPSSYNNMYYINISENPTWYNFTDRYGILHGYAGIDQSRTIEWELTPADDLTKKTLRISGFGIMEHFEDIPALWAVYRDIINEIVIDDSGDNITIGRSAFYGFSRLKSVDIPARVNSIDAGSFYMLASGLYNSIQHADVYINNPKAYIAPLAFGYLPEYPEYHSDYLHIHAKKGSTAENYVSGYGENSTVYAWSPVFVPTDSQPTPADPTVPVTDPNIYTASGKCGDDAYWYLGSDGTLSIVGSGALYDFEIDRSPWKAASNDYKKIKRIEIGSGITQIGEFAFFGCINAENAVIPEGVEYISADAFRGCSALTVITLPSTLKAISDEAFLGCTSLASVTVPSGVVYMGQDIFRGCNDLIIYGNRATTAEQYALNNNIPFSASSTPVTPVTPVTPIYNPSPAITPVPSVPYTPAVPSPTPQPAQTPVPQQPANCRVTFPENVTVTLNSSPIPSGTFVIEGSLLRISSAVLPGMQLDSLKVNGLPIINGQDYTAGTEDILITAEYSPVGGQTAPNVPITYPVPAEPEQKYPGLIYSDYVPSYIPEISPEMSSEILGNSNINHTPENTAKQDFFFDPPSGREVSVTLNTDLRDMSGGTVIRTSPDFFTEPAKVVIVNSMYADEAAENALDTMDRELPFYAFDISVCSADTGNIITLPENGYITFEMPLPEGMRPEYGKISVWHLVNGGSEPVPSEIYTDDSGIKRIKFTASSFSPYMFTFSTEEDISTGAGTAEAPAAPQTAASPVSDGVSLPRRKAVLSVKKRRYRILRIRKRSELVF